MAPGVEKIMLKVDYKLAKYLSKNKRDINVLYYSGVLPRIANALDKQEENMWEQRGMPCGRYPGIIPVKT